jgi:hypothetical protein
MARPGTDHCQTDPEGSAIIQKAPAVAGHKYPGNSTERGRRTVVSLKEYIASDGRMRRGSGSARGQLREDAASAISVTRSPGLHAASVALPAGIDLGDRAARMNEFWRALVEFQRRDVLVVALCAGGER